MLRPADRRGGFSTVMVLVLVGAVVLAAAAGFGIAMVATGSKTPEPAATAGDLPTEDPTAQGIINFGTVTVNLAGDRMTRYLLVEIALEVPKESEVPMTKLINEDRKAIFQDWLITYLSDKRREDIEGASGMNRLKRDILDGFNSLLAENGAQRVDGVRFTRYNVQ